MAALYSCFDFRLRSEIPLPELLVADDPNDRRPVVEVRLGEVGETMAGADQPYGGLQAVGSDALLTVGGVGRFLVKGGHEVIVAPFSEASQRNLRLFLLGSTLGILCHQRGLLPLHANAIVAHGGGFAFAGTSGAGKSTLAAYFARAGYPVLCDDVCAVDFGTGGTPRAWPGLPRLKLWGDASDRFGHDKTQLEPAIEGMDKYHVPLATPADAQPVPLKRLYLLSRTDGAEEGGITRLRGRAALEAVMAHTYRGFYLQVMGLSSRHFLQAAALSGQIEVYAATRAWGYDVFEREADRLANHLSEVE